MVFLKICLLNNCTHTFLFTGALVQMTFKIIAKYS